VEWPLSRGLERMMGGLDVVLDDSEVETAVRSAELASKNARKETLTDWSTLISI